MAQGSLIPLAKQLIPTNAWAPGVGYQFYTYAAGTLTPKATYQDSALSVANSNPVIADARGEVVMYGSGVYRIIAKDAAGATIWDRDNVDAGGYNGYDTGTIFQTQVNRVVDSISALRLLDKTKYTRASVTSYYPTGVGGVSDYWMDPADTTSVDDGHLVVVAADGGRWKLLQDTAVTAKQTGAKGDHATDDSAPLQKVFSLGQRGRTIPVGRYSFATGLANDYRTTPPFPAPGSPSARADISGESMANTILEYSGTGYAINLYGSDDTGAGQGLHSVDVYRNFTLQDKAFAKSNNGIYLQNKAFWKVSDVFAQYFGTGIELQSCFSGKVENSYFNYGNYGAKLTTNALGAINAINWDRCTFTGNAKVGVLGVAIGSANSFRDCTFEGNGTQGDLATGGFVGNLGAYGYAGPLTFDNCYFESNAGLADISIDNTTAKHLTVLIRGCLFNRASSAAYTNYNINVSSSGGGMVTVVLEGNNFVSAGSYVPDAARPFFVGTAGLVEFVDKGGNSFQETTSLVVPFSSGRSICGSVSAAGDVTSGPGFVTASKLSTGVYRVTSALGFGKSTSFYTALATSNDAGGTTLVRNITQQTASSFDVSIVNSALTPTDGAFSFNVMLRGGV